MVCLSNLVIFEPSNLDCCTEENFNTLGWIIYDNPKILSSSLILIGTIVAECGDEVIMKLLQNELLISLVKVIESS